VWAAAKKILEWRGEGVPFEDMGVVARNLEPFVGALDAVFRDNRIPFSSSARRPIEATPTWPPPGRC